jgi:hypothetical protein
MKAEEALPGVRRVRVAVQRAQAKASTRADGHSHRAAHLGDVHLPQVQPTLGVAGIALRTARRDARPDRHRNRCGEHAHRHQG